MLIKCNFADIPSGLSADVVALLDILVAFMGTSTSYSPLQSHYKVCIIYLYWTIIERYNSNLSNRLWWVYNGKIQYNGKI